MNSFKDISTLLMVLDGILAFEIRYPYSVVDSLIMKENNNVRYGRFSQIKNDKYHQLNYCFALIDVCEKGVCRKSTISQNSYFSVQMIFCVTTFTQRADQTYTSLHCHVQSINFRK